jgi:hypothetical protein
LNELIFLENEIEQRNIVKKYTAPKPHKFKFYLAVFILYGHNEEIQVQEKFVIKDIKYFARYNKLCAKAINFFTF